VVLAVGGGALFAVAIWPFAVLGPGVTEAEIIAGAHPYCIQVSGDGPSPYRSLTSLSDMNGLQMQAPLSQGFASVFQDTFHAVLIVQTHDAELAWRNWSYYRAPFVPIPEDTRKALYLSATSCAPKMHFVRQLPMFRSP
jgi:hypothetical protein